MFFILTSPVYKTFGAVVIQRKFVGKAPAFISKKQTEICKIISRLLKINCQLKMPMSYKQYYMEEEHKPANCHVSP